MPEGKQNIVKPKEQRAPFITLEGIDKTGKSTHSHFIKDWLAQKNINAILLREPGSTDLGEKLRDLVLKEEGIQKCSMAELLIICASRAQMVEEKLLPTLNNQTWVICDRFADSTFAYQHGGRGIPEKYVNALAEMTHNSIRPDLTFLFDLSLQQMKERFATNEERDRFEQEGDGFYNRICATYLKAAKDEPERWHIIDASQPIEQIQGLIGDILQNFLLKQNLS